MVVGRGSDKVLTQRRRDPADRPEVSMLGILGPACGRGSAGRASPCQGEGRGFESRRPLSKDRMPLRHALCGGVAEWLRQGPAKPCTRVRFPSPPRDGDIPMITKTFTPDSGGKGFVIIKYDSLNAKRHGPRAVPLRRSKGSGIASEVHRGGVGRRGPSGGGRGGRPPPAVRAR